MPLALAPVRILHQVYLTRSGCISLKVSVHPSSNNLELHTSISYSTEVCSLLYCKTRRFLIYFRIFDVDFLVGYVQIAYYNRHFLGLQLCHVFFKFNIPFFNSCLQVLQSTSGVHNVSADQEEVFKLDREDSALRVKIIFSKTD